jgi:hypothetical protein
MRMKTAGLKTALCPYSDVSGLQKEGDGDRTFISVEKRNNTTTNPRRGFTDKPG